MTRVCSDCPSPITRQSKTGRCRPCASRNNHRDPAFVARLYASSAAGKRTPKSRAKARASALRREAERKNDPAWQSMRIDGGKQLRARYEASPEAQAANQAKRAEAGAKISASKLGWLPDELRAEYLALRDAVGAGEARRMTEDLIASTERRRVAALSPFERDMERIAKGARIVEQFTPRKADHAFSIIGSSMA